MKSKEVIKILKDDGWKVVNQRGSHIYLKHDIKKGKITVPYHNKDLKPKTLKSILSQAELL